ncbi:MAG: nucleotidyltransferase family protein [Nocardioidaceae bacterium]
MNAAAESALPAIAAFGLPGSQLALPDHPLDEATWDDLMSVVRLQRLSGLLMSAVLADAMPVTDEQADQVHRVQSEEMAVAVMLERTLLEITTELDRTGIPWRVLKGSAVAHLDYTDPSLRPFCDVDLLVPAADFDRAGATLQANGYRRRFPQPRPGFDRQFSKGASFFRLDGLSLDLHRTFVMGPFGLGIRLEDLWADSEHFELAGRSLPALSPELRLMHAAYHAALGDWPPRLLPQRDLAEMVLFGGHDEEALLACAQRWAGEAVLAQAVRTMWALFALADVTALSTWAERHEASDRDRRALSVYTSPDSSYAAKSVAALRAIPGFRSKLSYVRALTFPTRGYLGVRHSSALSRLAYGVRGGLAARDRAP